MKAWLVYEREGAERNLGYIDMHMKYGRERGVDFSLIICDEEDFPEKLPDFAIVRAMRPDITKRLEDMGVRVFNNSHVSSICNNKARTYEYLHKNNIPVIPWVSATQAEKPPEIAEYPRVIKPASGHGGKSVCLIKNDDEYKRAREAIFPDEYVLQPLATETGRDTRVYIVGNAPVAAVQRIAKRGDFRSNFSLGGAVEKAELSDEERELIQRVTALFDFGLCGIDIMYHEGKPVINEIEDVVGARMLYKTHDIDILAIYLDHIVKTLNS